MHNRTPAQLYAMLVGAVLVAAGLLGFLYSAGFAVGGDVPRDAVLGILDVNGWHNIVHLATGALGLATFVRPDSARAYALGLGAVYLLVAIWGFVLGNGVILNLVPVNMPDNFLHLLIALAGFAAGFASRGVTAGSARTA